MTARQGQKRCPSGGAIYAGMLPPATVGLPSWISNTLLEVVAIPGTSGADGAPMHAWGSYAVDRANSTIYIGANGGHEDSYDNRWSKNNLGLNTPVWQRLIDPTPFASVIPNTSHGADGRPTSRHNYDYCHYTGGKVLLTACRARYIDGNTSNGVVDEYDIAANTLAPAGTHPSATAYGAGCAVNTVTGKILFRQPEGTSTHYDPVAKTYGASVNGNGTTIRYPVAHDEVDNQYFCLQWGNGEQTSGVGGLQASKVNASTLVQTNVTFNASAAYTQFLNEQFFPSNPGLYVGCAGMTYDNLNDCFYWYSGYAGREGHIYKITKSANNTDPWDMSLLVLTGALLPTAPDAGINGRIKFMPGLKGFIICPTGTGTIYHIRTAV